MEFVVYILYSSAYNITYTGQTENLQNRLIKHNSGKVRSTKAYIPWKMIYHETFNTRAEAIRRESWYKTPEGRKKIKVILGQYLAALDG